MENNAYGMNIITVLLIIFIVLKLTKTGPIAAWSWWWVLSPIWIPFVITIVTIAILLVIAAVVAGIKFIINY